MAWQRKKLTVNKWGLGKNPKLKKDKDGIFVFLKTTERNSSIYLICDPKKNGQPKFEGNEIKKDEYKFHFTHADVCPKGKGE